MFQAPEQLVALNKANLEAAVRFAGIALEGAERMLELQLKTAKSAFADGVQQAKALAEVKDMRTRATQEQSCAAGARQSHELCQECLRCGECDPS